MDWRTRLDETRAPFNFYYLTLSGSGGDVDKVSIRNCRFRPRLGQLELKPTERVAEERPRSALGASRRWPGGARNWRAERDG